MVIAPDMPLREIVFANPGAADLFDRFNIDYFCGGSQLLGDVLRAHEISLDAFADALTRIDSPAAPDWRMASLRALIQHIVENHHEYLRRELPFLDDSLQRIDQQVEASNPGFVPALHSAVHQLRREVELQMRKEEAILFPAIAGLERSESLPPGLPAPSQFGSVANLSRVMSKEYEKTGRNLREIIRLIQQYEPVWQGLPGTAVPLAKLRALVADMHRHVHLENNILYPRAVELEKGGRDGDLEHGNQA